MTRYTTEFHLVNPIQEGRDVVRTANAYLNQYDMTQFLPDNLSPIVSSLVWRLEDEDHGVITVETVRDLTAAESTALTAWISGQCSDGLGEGFEQQPFAQTSNRDWSYRDDHDYNDYDEDGNMASFDWEHDRYQLSKTI
jgi:hypothetical protein